MAIDMRRITPVWTPHRRWLYIRLTWVIAFGFGGLFMDTVPAAANQSHWIEGFVVLLFVPLFILFVTGLQIINPLNRSKVWHRPSWAENPFNLAEPLQFFHLMGYSLLAQGTVILLHTQMLPLVLFFGLATILGVRLCMTVYRRRFAEQLKGPEKS